MNFTMKTDYTLRILNYIAQDFSKIYQANDLHRKLDIPFVFLRKFLTLLSKRDLIISIQGKGGGCKIARNPKDIFLIDIIKATGEKIKEKECFFGYDECSEVEKCSMHDKWLPISNNINKLLAKTSLAEL